MYTFLEYWIQINRNAIILFHFFIHKDLLPNYLLICTFEHLLALTILQVFVPSNPKPSVLNILAADNPKPSSCWLGGVQWNWAGREHFNKSQKWRQWDRQFGKIQCWQMWFSPRTSQRVEKLQQEFHYQHIIQAWFQILRCPLPKYSQHI